MEVVKESKDYKVFKKRSGRYAVKDAAGKWVNGVDKIKLLVKEGLIKAAIPKKEPDPPAEEAPAEAAPAEEAPAEEPKE